MASERFQTLTLFSSIYGIGLNTSRRLYGLGLRTLKDLEIYYGVDSSAVRKGAARGEIVEVEEKQSRYYRRNKPGDGQGGGEEDDGLGDSWIRVALELREDLALK